METKRFVIRKSLIGKNTIITFVNKKNETVKYNHDEVYNAHKERFESKLSLAHSERSVYSSMYSICTILIRSLSDNIYVTKNDKYGKINRKKCSRNNNTNISNYNKYNFTVRGVEQYSTTNFITKINNILLHNVNATSNR